MKRRDFVCYFSSVLMGAAAFKYIKMPSDTEENNLSFQALRYIEVHIADHCNLNCKYCSHFSPIADKKFYKLSEFKKDMKRLSKVTNKEIVAIRIMGGEPLLNPDVSKYLAATRKYFPNSRIHLLTNGILLASQKEDFWTNLYEKDIVLEISEYPIDINFEYIKEKASEYKVELLTEYGKHKNLYFDKMSLDLSASQKDLAHCKHCFTGGCLNLYEGKIFACPVIAYIKYFNKKFNKNIEVSSSDYLDLYKTRNIDEITEWMDKPKDFCRYCAPTKKVLWEMGTEHGIDEWV